MLHKKININVLIKEEHYEIQKNTCSSDDYGGGNQYFKRVWWRSFFRIIIFISFG